MRRTFWIALLVSLPFRVSAEEGNMKVWRFDDAAVSQAPAHMQFDRTGEGKAGRWVVQADKTAPSGGHVLAQLDTDATDYRFPVAVTEASAPADVRVEVACKPVSGKVDQACGVVVRYQDRDNYYVARANALEGNVRLYHVKAGKRVQLASWRGKIAAGTWHRLALEARGDQLKVSWNGATVLEHEDKTFSSGGRVGVWTKADSVTYFDDLSMTPL
jgi:hypothetical protein